jgi:preprotein translocase subunit YajC
MFVSTAYAQTAGGGSGLDVMTFLPLILIFVVFYFLMLRPQQQKLRDHKAMVNAVRRGDRVVTGGGIIGTVTKAGSDDELQVEIAEGVRVRVLRSTLTTVLAKTEPVRATKPDDSDTPPPPADEPKGTVRTLAKILGRK